MRTFECIVFRFTEKLSYFCALYWSMHKSHLVCTLGYGGLGLSIEGPSKVDINCSDVEDGTCKVTYCPTEPGTYIINIKFADQHVPGTAQTSNMRAFWGGRLSNSSCRSTGSPFTVKVLGEGRMKESITRKRQAPSISTVGSTCDLNLKIPGEQKKNEMLGRVVKSRVKSFWNCIMPCWYYIWFDY